MELICKTTRKPDITLHAGGRIEISREAARGLHIEDGDVFTIVKIGGNLAARISIRNGDRHGRHAGECHATNAGGEHFRAFSSALYKVVKAELSVTDTEKIAFNAGKARKHKDLGSYLPLFSPLSP